MKVRADVTVLDETFAEFHPKVVGQLYQQRYGWVVRKSE